LTKFVGWLQATENCRLKTTFMIKIYLNLDQLFLLKNALLKKQSFLIMVFALLFSATAFGQPDSVKALLQKQQNQFNQPIDFSFDTSKPVVNRQTISLDSIKFSKDSIDSPVIYSADDSMHLEAKTQIVHLYGNATVKYQDFALRAGYIALDVENKLVLAEGLPDSSGRMSSFPVFADKSQEFTAKKIKYNFETQKGIIYDITTEQQGGYIRSGKAKIVMGVKNDSIKQANDQFFAQDGIFTTCDHEIPHFGIRSNKQKVIPDKEVIVGPSNLEIMGIPTPLWIPFGFFPLNIEQKSGLIFPRDYEFSPRFGFGLKNLGWYFELGDHWDLQLTGDIYSRGTFAVNAATNYKYKYKYSGNFNVRYDRQRFGDPETPTFSLNETTSIRWSHNQDSKAHPTQRFSGNVNMTLGNNRQVFNDAENVLNANLSSNVSYSKSWTGKPYRLSLSASHNQNKQTREFSVILPQLDFQMNRITPFEKKSGGGKPSWYESIGFSYSVQAQNKITATDTTIFTREALNDAQYGVKHSIPVSTNFTIFKYFQVTPSINYSEKWYFNTSQRTFNSTETIEADTIFDADDGILSITQDTTFGFVEAFKQNEFKSLREFNTGVSVSTQLFGTMNNLKIGRLRALRHTLKPSFSYNYTPDYTTPFWGYFDEVQLDTRYPDELQRYSLFEDGIYGSPSASGLSSAVGFNLSSLLEGKMQEKGDTTNSAKNYKKVQILRSITTSASWNFAADSLQLSTIPLNMNTMLFKKITVGFRSTFDPYAANEENNQRINTFEWTKNKRPLRMTSMGVTLSTSLKWSEIQNILQGKTEEDQGNSKANPATTKGINYVDNIRLGYDFRINQRYIDGVDSIYISTNSLSLSGTVNLTSQWKITVGRIGYDFVKQQLTYPDFQFYRSLHCWEMGTSWQPSRGTYSFFIRVRQAPLDFLKIPYGRGNYDIIPNF
jgi:hypothetical protein